MFFVLLLITMTDAAMVSSGIESCDTSDAAMLNCATHLADLDHDNRLSRAEIDYALTNTIRYTAGVTVELVMRMDYNEDGFVDMTDWNNATRRFYKDTVTQTMACFFCRQNGIAMNLLQKRDNMDGKIHPAVCDTSDDRLIQCMSILFDANKDNIITPAELEAGLIGLPFPQGLTAAVIMRGGDVNKDGVLTRAGDWDTPKRQAFRDRAEKQFACTFCQKNHVSMMS